MADDVVVEEGGRGRRRVLVLGAAGVVVMCLCLFALLVAGGDGDDEDTAAVATATSVPAASETAAPAEPTASPMATLTDEELVDQAINEGILGLACTEADFAARVDEWSGYADPERSSLAEQLVVFEEGYAETEPALRGKLLEATARAFRDFPCLEAVTVVIEHPAGDWTAEAEVAALEAFLGVSFATLREDINNWRAFLAAVDEAMEVGFVEQFVTRP